MKKTHQFFLSFLACLILILPNTANAKKEIGVIDFVKVIGESEAGKAIKTQLLSKEKEYTEQIKSKEAELNSKKEELNNQKELIEPEAFDKRYNEFKQEVFNTQKDIHAKKVLLETKKNEAIEKVRTTAVDIIKGVAEEQNLAIVLTKSTVIHTDLSADITEEVLKRLNKSIPEITIDFSE